MKAPEHERAELLGVAIRAATDLLRAPIDKVEVAAEHIRCWADGRKVVLAYQYRQGTARDPSTGNFVALPGSGDWIVTQVEDPAARRPETLGLAAAKFLKKRGW